MSRLLLLVGLFSHTLTHAIEIDTLKYKSIEQLISSEKISAEFEGTGGHTAECMQVKITNNQDDTAYVWVEGGRRLISENEHLQDIFVVKNALLAIAPGTTDSTALYGFCCQASNGGPGKGDKFKVGRMAPKKWVDLAHFVEEQSFPVHAVQSAVWVMSDGHDIGSITHDSTAIIEPLKKKVAELLGYKVPWYSLTYQDDPNRVFSNVPDRIKGEVPFYINTHCIVTIVIKNQFGENVAFPVREEANGPGENTYVMDQPVSDWGPGKYTIWIVQDYYTPIKKKIFYLNDYD
mgnify:CR=1 FL=1